MSGIRIWHQSITDLSRQQNYAHTLRQQAARVSDAEVVVHGVVSGTYPEGMSAGQVIRYPWARYLVDVQIIENIRRAEREGFDVVAMSCFLDPGLDEGRSAVDIPVLSICESTMAQAMPFGRRYGMLCLDQDVAAMVRDRACGYGFVDRIADVVSVDPPLTGLQLEAAYADFDVIRSSLEVAVGTLRNAGADLLIPAEGILNTLFVHHDITEFGGLPIFDSYAALIAQAELVTTLRQRAGGRVSHEQHWPRPPQEIFDSVCAATARALVG